MTDDATLAGPALSPERPEVLPTLESRAETMGGAPRSREDKPVGRGTEVGATWCSTASARAGWGVVYAAYDPELDRKVAVKLLQPAPGGGADATGRTRLMREAQALAKLSRPHVVTRGSDWSQVSCHRGHPQPMSASTRGSSLRSDMTTVA